jgi:hypothetical protein
MLEVEYKIPPYGLGTDFTESERPITFAGVYTNRFRNVTGGAQRRPGASKNGAAVPGIPTLTRLHEHCSNSGAITLLSSDDSGNIYVYSSAASAWSTNLTGKASLRLISAQTNDKLIFVNGSDRNFYTDDGGATYKELKALIITGLTAGGTNTTTLIDGNVSNWINQVLISNNDIVHNITRGGYGIVSTIASASLTHTKIGIAGDGAGRTSADQTSGDSYEIIDHVNMLIIPNGTPVKTNVATAITGTSTTVIAVSSLDFSTTEARAGDFIYNTTRGTIAQIGTISANINLQQSVSGQIAGDSISFFKSAMPIASWVHVHYGRVYYLDSRKQTRIVISAPDDPQDVTTYQQTLDSTSFSFGTQQPTGDVMKCMTSFQQYFVVSGEKNLYIYRGITPIADASSTTIDFTPIAFYPNGVVGRFGLGTNGTDLLHVVREGLQAINIGSISYTTIQNNVSVPIRTDVARLIQSTPSDNIQISFYPHRSWLIMKIGDSCYILNTNPSYDETGQLSQIPSWHLFTGPWAQLNHYFIRKNGDLIGCGTLGQVYMLDDDNNNATDYGSTIETDLVTSWLRLEEPQRTPRIKEGKYIRPIFESGANIGYTINVVAGWDGLSSDSIVVSAVNTNAAAIGRAIIGTTPIGAGTFVQVDKFPFRWRGEQARVEFTTNSQESPDIITGFYLYGDVTGVR